MSILEIKKPPGWPGGFYLNYFYFFFKAKITVPAGKIVSFFK
jgi:hypothetical protein